MNTFLTRYAAWVTQRRWLVYAIVLLATVAFAMSASQLRINATPYFLSKSHPSRVAEQQVKQTFTNTGEQAYIALVAHSGTVFDKPILQLVANLSTQLYQLSLTGADDVTRLESLGGDSTLRTEIDKIVAGGLGREDIDALQQLKQDLNAAGALDSKGEQFLADLTMRAAPVRRVRSLATIENITAEGDVLDVHTLMRTVPTSSDGIAAIQAETLANPLYINGLISPDGKATSIQVELAISEDDSPNMIRTYNAISDLLSTVKLDVGLHLSGPPMIATQTASSMKHDNDTLFPGVILVVLVTLFLSFRSFKATIQPLLIAILSVIWTMGSMALLGVEQNIVTTMLPVFLISIGVADSIHFLSEFNKQRQAGSGAAEAAKAALAELWAPMLMTSITTAVGFASLAYTNVIFVKYFGVFVGLGVIYAWLLTMLLLPALAAGAKAKADAAAQPAPSAPRSQALRGIANTLHANRFAVIGVALAVLVVSFIGIMDLRVDNRVIGYFKPEARIRVDDKVFNEHFGGTTLVNLVFSADRPDAFKRMDLVSAVDQVERSLRADPQVGYSYSVAEFVRRLNQMLHGGDPAYYALPQPTENILAQYFLLYENSRGRDLFDVVDHRYQTARIAFAIKTDQSSLVKEIVDKAVQHAHAVMPKDVRISVAGYGDILVATTQEIVYGQVQSLILSMVLVVLLMIAMFRSLALGILSVIPLLLTMVFNFAAMGFLQVSLDIGTAIVASIAVGVGIDYAIHFISRYRHEMAQSGHHETALVAAFEGVGRPIILNSIALAAGFLVLTLSDYAALVHLGVLIAATMIFSAVVTLLLLPALLSLLTAREPVVRAPAVAIEQEG